MLDPVLSTALRVQVASRAHYREKQIQHLQHMNNSGRNYTKVDEV